MTTKLDELKALPGLPWHPGFFVGNGYNICAVDGRVIAVVKGQDEFDKRDMSAIVAAVNALPALIAAVEALRNWQEWYICGSFDGKMSEEAFKIGRKALAPFGE